MGCDFEGASVKESHANSWLARETFDKKNISMNQASPPQVKRRVRGETSRPGEPVQRKPPVAGMLLEQEAQEAVQPPGRGPISLCGHTPQPASSNTDFKTFRWPVYSGVLQFLESQK